MEKRKGFIFKKVDLVSLRSFRVSNYQNNICAKLEGPYIVATENNVSSYVLKN